MRELCAELHGLGVFNMLLSDSRTLYAHCGKRLCTLTRRAPFGTATLIDEDWRWISRKETTPDDIVTVVATRPLTRDEKLDRPRRPARCWPSASACRTGTRPGPARAVDARP